MTFLSYKDFLLETKENPTSYSMEADTAATLVRNNNLKNLFLWIFKNTPTNTFAVDSFGITRGEFQTKQLTIKASYDNNVAPLLKHIEKLGFVTIEKSFSGSARGGFTTLKVDYPSGEESDIIKIINSKKDLNRNQLPTNLQEGISLFVFKMFIEKGHTNIQDKDVLEGIQELWPTAQESQEWMNSWQQQGITLKNYLNGAKGYSYFQRNGFPQSLYDISKSAGFAQPDSWDPADVWLVKNPNKHDKDIGKIWQEYQSIDPVNDYLREHLKNKEIIPISLKLTGKVASLQEVNIQELVENGTLAVTKIFCDLTPKEVRGQVKFNIAGARIDVNDGSVFYCRQATRGSFVIEGQPPKGKAQYGKVPSAIYKNTLGTDAFIFSMWIKSFDQQGNLVEMFNALKTSSLVDSGIGNISADEFMEQMHRAFDDPRTRDEVYAQKAMGMLVSYQLINMNNEDRNKAIAKLYYSSQKAGDDFGPFIKIY